ncbi:MAG: FAD-dependent oxidoreductase, partial [Deltaproteobacteria bacterium]|nr:FAD-dependent oxidoreductase [Deltaproteobacteria bacterium]
TGLLQERTAAVVVNAAGAWAAQVAAMAGQLLRLRLRRCVQLRAARPLGVFGLVARAIDGRQVHLLPVRQSMLIGTTDDDWLGEPDDPQVNLQDVEYLLQAVAELDPALHQTPLLDTLVGLRAAEQDWSSDRFSYGARLVDHGLTGASGLLSVVGGSLASYRAIAELTVDRLCWRLKRTLPCRTHRLPLPGGERQIHVPLLAESVGLPVEVVRLLVSRQGDRAREVLAGSPGEQEIVCACSGVTAAEIHHVIRYEWVRDLAALRRRTELGRGTCHGCRCAGRAAQLIGLELGLSPRHVRALVLQDEGVRYRMQLPVAGGTVSARLAMQRMLSLTGRDLEECS